jgi:hypothetical protein
LADGLDRLHRTYYRLRAALFESAQATSSARVVSLHPGVSVLAAGLVDKTQGPTFVMDLTSDHSQPIAGESSRSAAVAWTVSSIVSERLVVNGSLVVGGQQALASTDVITVFAAARLAQVPFQLLRPGDASKIQAMSVSPQARARIEARLAQGRSLLLPARPPSTAFQTDFGWWEVDLEDGVVRDEMENGRHGQGPEYVATDEPARRTAPWWQRLGCAVVFGTALGIASFEAYEGNPEGAAEGTEVIMTEFDRARRAEEIEEEIDAALKGRCR